MFAGGWEKKKWGLCVCHVYVPLKWLLVIFGLSEQSERERDSLCIVSASSSDDFWNICCCSQNEVFSIQSSMNKTDRYDAFCFSFLFCPGEELQGISESWAAFYLCILCMFLLGHWIFLLDIFLFLWLHINLVLQLKKKIDWWQREHSVMREWTDCSGLYNIYSLLCIIVQSNFVCL